jgi:hypothetical protein
LFQDCEFCDRYQDYKYNCVYEKVYLNSCRIIDQVSSVVINSINYTSDFLFTESNSHLVLSVTQNFRNKTFIRKVSGFLEMNKFRIIHVNW